MNTETLSAEQIKAWRNIIALQLVEKATQFGMSEPNMVSMYAFFMPEEEVINYWRKTKALLENPDNFTKSIQSFKSIRTKQQYKKSCNHSNSITGSKGKYCIDCEMYV